MACGQPAKDQKSNQTYVEVSSVVDGDTFWIINTKGKREKIRLIGIDAPESRKTGRKEIGYFGKESKEYLTQLILDQKVRLEYDVQLLDRFQRTLAYVYLKDNTFVNELLVRTGHAIAVTYPPNVKYQKVFEKAQQRAQKSKVGLWAKDDKDGYGP